MYPHIYISSYVKGPVNFEPKGRRSVSPWAFRVSDPELCASLRQSHAGTCRDDRTFYQLEAIEPSQIKVGDMILVENGQLIHADGIIRKGAALIDESVVTGDSTQVLRESGGHDHVMRDTLVVSGAIIVETEPRLGHSLDWIAHDKRELMKANDKAMSTESLLVDKVSPKTICDKKECSGR